MLEWCWNGVEMMDEVRLKHGDVEGRKVVFFVVRVTLRVTVCRV